MRKLAAIAMAAFTGCAWAGPQVTACMSFGPDARPLVVAEKLASGIFADIGVETEWPEQLHHGNPCPANATAVITLSYDSSSNDHPRAWAYALPYEGKHIVVFWDRILKKVPPERAPFLLAYVLVHEITHILQGINRHSPSGVMKAVWDEDDIFRMWSRKPLGFTKSDIELIYRGLEVRPEAAPGVTAMRSEK